MNVELRQLSSRLDMIEKHFNQLLLKLGVELD